MSAVNNLAAFVYKLPDELQPEFMKLVDAVTDERDRLQNERIGQSMARLGNYEVVAIAGTAETLLSDVINVGDTVECISKSSMPINNPLDKRFYKGDTDVVIDVWGDRIKFPRNESYYFKSHFRKVSTPIVNPLNSVEGC